MDFMVIPVKSGNWRIVALSEVPLDKTEVPYARFSIHRLDVWNKAYKAWWERKGHRLALSPEMWQTNGLFR